MNSRALRFLCRTLILLLAGLLVLGPFLHKHLGASHVTGFHLDGVHVLQSQPAGDVAAQAQEDESPALGVSASVPQPDNAPLAVLMCALVLLAWPLLRAQALPLPRARPAAAQGASRYRAGLPPPCLAPPAA